MKKKEEEEKTQNLSESTKLRVSYRIRQQQKKISA